LPHITYQMGSLENGTTEQPGIRQAACRILEGGDIAFQTRENRYAIGRKPATTDALGTSDPLARKGVNSL
jgi:hypothetical protein